LAGFKEWAASVQTKVWEKHISFSHTLFATKKC